MIIENRLRDYIQLQGTGHTHSLFWLKKGAYSHMEGPGKWASVQRSRETSMLSFLNAPFEMSWRIKKTCSGFPGGTMVKNPPASAGHMGSSPGPGRSHMPWSNQSHVPQLLSLCSRARVPQLLKPARLATREATTTRSPQPRVVRARCN